MLDNAFCGTAEEKMFGPLAPMGRNDDQVRLPAFRDIDNDVPGATEPDLDRAMDALAVDAVLHHGETFLAGVHLANVNVLQFGWNDGELDGLNDRFDRADQEDFAAELAGERLCTLEGAFGEIPKIERNHNSFRSELGCC